MTFWYKKKCQQKKLLVNIWFTSTSSPRPSPLSKSQGAGAEKSLDKAAKILQESESILSPGAGGGGGEGGYSPISAI